MLPAPHRVRLVTLVRRALALLCVLVPASGTAQVFRGTVVDRGDLPVAGVVVTLVDSGLIVRGRALSNERGDYSIRAPNPGTYRLRALRIGYRPVLSRQITVAMGQAHDERLVLDGIRVTLAAVIVEGRSACGRRPGDEARAVFAAWDQAMTSIAATSLTSSSRGLTATTMQVQRKLEPGGRRVLSQTASVSTNYVRQPWTSLPAEVLRIGGYAVLDAQGATTYNAPGLDVLSSPKFLDDHCLRLVAARDTSEIGVAFEPNATRRRNAEIRGTLWMVRATSQLLRMEFTYTNVPDAPPVAGNVAGGAMAFTRLRDGAIVISRWEIRMPQLERESRSATVRVAGISSVGGELVVVRQGTDTLFKRPTFTVSGTVLDSTSGAAVGNATVGLVGTAAQATTGLDGRFTLSDVLPGEYTIAVRTPSLDSIRAARQSTLVIAEGITGLDLRVPTATQLAASLCGNALTGAGGRGKGAVIGTVRDGADTIGVANVRVVGDWTESAVRTGAGAVRQQGRRLETRTDATGAFRLCGVPTETPLVVRALPDSGRSESVSVRLSPDERFSSTRLTIDRQLVAAATLRGLVQADSTRAPLGDVEILLPELSLGTRSDETGAFSVDGIPPGTHRVVARRAGFGSLESQLTFSPNGDEERLIILTRLTTPPEVTVAGGESDSALGGFDDHRRLGLGEFLTRQEIAESEGRRISDVLAKLPGVVIVGRGGRAYIQSRRYTMPPAATDDCRRDTSPMGSSFYVPNAAERGLGVTCTCYAQVYVDDELMNTGRPTEPFDVNSIPTAEIEVIEWYATPAQIPVRYARSNSACGVYVVHRRGRRSR